MAGALKSAGVRLLHLGRKRVPLRETGLVPVGVDFRHGAGPVQFRDLFQGEIPPDCAQILEELALVAGARPW